MATVRKDLGEALAAKGAITAEQLSQARDAQRAAPGDIGRIIVDLGFADEKAVAEVRAEALGLQFVDLATQKLDPAAVNSIPERIAKARKILPISKNGSKMTVAFVNPDDVLALQDVRLTSGVQQITMVLATEDDLMEAVDRAYRSDGGGSEGGPSTPSVETGMNPFAGGGGGALMDSGMRQAIAGYAAKEEIV